VAPDVSRPITGAVKDGPNYGLISYASEVGGVFRRGSATPYCLAGHGQPGYALEIDSSLVNPAGPENSPRTMSVRYWRRVA